MEELPVNAAATYLQSANRDIAHDGGVNDLLGSTSSHAGLDARGQLLGQNACVGQRLHP
jgi:hypothetical protein